MNLISTQRTRSTLMHCLGQVARKTGEVVLTIPAEQVLDTVQVGNHSFSNVDSVAGAALRQAIATYIPGFNGTVMEECDIARMLAQPTQVRFPLLICDAVEGSTNTRRGLASHFPRPILAGTSIVALQSNLLGSTIASAFYDFNSHKVYSAFRGEAGYFVACVDDRIIIPTEEITEKRGDKRNFAAIIGYSHNNIRIRTDVEEALLKAGIFSTGGSRSSAQDLLDLCANQIDAYVDLRGLFPGRTVDHDQTLHFWDVGGLLPFLDSLGFVIADHKGRSWQDFTFEQPLSLIICRPSIYSDILQALNSLPFLVEDSSDPSILSIGATP